MNKRVSKALVLPIFASLFTCSLISCNGNNTPSKEDVIKAEKFSISNKVNVTFDAGEGYVDQARVLHSTQISVNRGLKWKYIYNRMPKDENLFLANHTFNYWTYHGEKIDDNYDLNNDITVTASFTPNKINFIQLNAGTEGTFDSGGTTFDVAEFDANQTYSELLEGGIFKVPTPTESTKMFAGYKDQDGKYIDLDTHINYEQPGLGKYVLTATYATKPTTDFSSDSWESVVAASNRGLNYLKDAYSETTFIGKTKELEINGVTYTVKVIGEEEDVTTTGTKAALTFEFMNVLMPNQAYDGYINNNNSYNNCSVATSLNKLIEAFPDCLKGDSGIRAVNKVTNKGEKKGKDANETYELKLFPLSAKEMNKNDDVQELTGINTAKTYKYYADSSRTFKDYVRFYIDPISKEQYQCDYWLRSPDYESNIAANCMQTTGEVYGNPIDINIGKGVAPAFCIGTSAQNIKITFDVKTEGGKWGTTSVKTDKQVTKKSGNALSIFENSIPTPTKDGSTFVGWYTHTAAGELDEIYSSTTKVYVDTTLYAHFIDDASLAKITFNGNNQYESSGAERTLMNEDYVTTITPSSTNDTHQAPTSTRGIEVLDASGKAISSFTVDTTGKLTIPGKYVTGNITINVKYGTIASNIESKIKDIATQDEQFSRSGSKKAGEYARQFFSIGDILNVSFNNGSSITTLRAILIGMGHSSDTFTDNDKEVISAFTFDFLDMPDVEIAYSSNDKPSYADSTLKTTAESYYDKLTNDTLKEAIKETSHVTTKNYAKEEYDSFKAKMFVLSAAEHTNITEAEAPSEEGKQYEYYAKYSDHGKYKNGGLRAYWLRSSYVTDSGYNRSYYVYSSGDYYSYSSYHKVNYNGVAMAFCI